MFDLQTISAALDLLKGIARITKDIKNVELQQQISGLMSKLLEVQQALATMQDENQSLREEIRRLREAEGIKSTLEFEGDVYWRKAGEKYEGPFCPTCFDANQQLIRLHRVEGIFNLGPGRLAYGYDCSQRKARFLVPVRTVKRFLELESES